MFEASSNSSVSLSSSASDDLARFVDGARMTSRHITIYGMHVNQTAAYIDDWHNSVPQQQARTTTLC